MSRPPRRARRRPPWEHWRSTLEAAPRSMFDFETAPAAPAERFVRLAFESSALAVAVDQVAQRRALSASTVLLAATAAVLGAWTGHDRTPRSSSTG